MEEEKRKLSVHEVRRTIATALVAAFGFVIALLWRDAVVGVLDVYGISLVPGAGLLEVGVFVLAAVIVTIAMVGLIVTVSRWSGKE
ncbi:MAG: DUF5654 family protein [Thermoplasmata archaeon]